MTTNTRAANPVFVVGALRSGTSLLYSLLNQHPKIALMYECDAWDFPKAFARRRFRGNWLARQEFYNQTLSRHRLTWGWSLRGLEKVRTPDDLYATFCQTRGAVLWGEKSPHYTARLLQLARLYPDASFILIWRDPVEIYRSIRAAGLRTPYFNRPGMLHRLVYHKEKMIREAAKLSGSGARVYQLTYNDLVDRTPEVCRGICEFLGIEFVEGMSRLESADLTPVYEAPQHEHLRRRIVERRSFSGNNLLADGEIARLERFRNRWERLTGRRLRAANGAGHRNEPSRLERFYYQCVGAALFLGKSAKRLMFEFTPLPWLRTYRLFKKWFHDGAQPEPGLRHQLREHWPTLTASFTLLAAICALDFVTGPDLNFGGLYVLPIISLALVVNRRWGIIAAFIAAVSMSFIRFRGNDLNLAAWLEMGWNFLMRLIVLGIIVVVFDRIRRELALNAKDKT